MIAVVLALSSLIGVSLGLLGGGGSILTVPILAYVAGMPPKAAIASSLFVVAITSAAGAITHARAGRVRWRTAILLGVAGMVGAFAGGHLAGYLAGHALMLMFAGMMFATAFAMMRGRRAAPAPARELPVTKVLAQGAVIGLVAGTVGAGGGFLIVPTLVLVGGLPIDAAIGTSLVVISMQSAAGFIGHLGHADLDLPLTLAVTGTAVVGSFIGGSLTGKISPGALRRGFGAFVLLMAILVLTKELL